MQFDKPNTGNFGRYSPDGRAMIAQRIFFTVNSMVKASTAAPPHPILRGADPGL
jgi:hypothetical protein